MDDRCLYGGLSRDPELVGLDRVWDRFLELAIESMQRGSLAIAAVITSKVGSIIAEGSNQIFEKSPSANLIRGASTAHAEINAISAIPERYVDDRYLSRKQVSVDYLEGQFERFLFTIHLVSQHLIRPFARQNPVIERWARVYEADVERTYHLLEDEHFRNSLVSLDYQQIVGALWPKKGENT